jgi:heme exporter protein A
LDPEPRTLDCAIEARGLTLAYGATRALAAIDLRVGWGERLAVFGPNGAGKTTLLRALGGLARPTDGALRVGGHSAGSVAARRLVGVVAHQTYLYEELTARENLRFYARLYGVDGVDARVDAVLEQVGLYQRRDARVGALSRGMQQRLALARAVLHDPPIQLLDEPDTGLDLASFQILEAFLLGGGGRERTVVLASHDLELGLRLAHRVALLVAGRLVYVHPAAGLDPPALEAIYRQASGQPSSGQRSAVSGQQGRGPSLKADG